MVEAIAHILSNVSEGQGDMIVIASVLQRHSIKILFSPNKVYDLNEQEIRDALENLHNDLDPFCDQHAGSSLENFVEAALKAFTTQTFVARNKHLILLTSDFECLCVDTVLRKANLEDAQLHIIGISQCYWPQAQDIFKKSQYGGWCFPFVSTEVTVPDVPFQMAMQNMSSFINNLRSRTSVGYLECINIQILPAHNVSIGAILGQQAFERIHAGEKKTLLLRLDVGPEPKLTSDHATSPISQLEFIESDLSASLGELDGTLFDVVIKYNHVLFPPETKLSTSLALNIKRFDANSVWCPFHNTNPFYGGWCKSSISSDYIRKALIQKIVSEHEDPKMALEAVQTIAYSTTHQNLDYCNTIRELRYQIRFLSKKSERSNLEYNKSQSLEKESAGKENTMNRKGYILEGPSNLTYNTKLSLEGIESNTTPRVLRVAADSSINDSNNILYQSVLPDMIPRVRTADTATRLWQAMDRTEQDFEEIMVNRRSFSLPHDQATLRNIRETEFSPWVV